MPPKNLKIKCNQARQRAQELSGTTIDLEEDAAAPASSSGTQPPLAAALPAPDAAEDGSDSGVDAEDLRQANRFPVVF